MFAEVAAATSKGLWGFREPSRATARSKRSTVTPTAAAGDATEGKNSAYDDDIAGLALLRCRPARPGRKKPRRRLRTTLGRRRRSDNNDGSALLLLLLARELPRRTSSSMEPPSPGCGSSLSVA